MTSKDFDKKRLQDLADNITKDQELLKDYEDSLREEREPSLRKKYSRTIKELGESIAKHKQEYAELKEKEWGNRMARISDNQPISSPIHQASPEHPPLLFDLLLQIDFKQQFRLVKTVIDKHQTIGFLVHGELDCGQQMLVNRLYRVKSTWQHHKPIAIDVSSNGVGSNLGKLWGRVAGCVGLERDAEHSLILKRICDRLKTQDVIFIFSKVELMLYTKTLIPWLEEFWQPLVRMTKTIEYFKETHLLMFLVDNCGKVCQSEVTLAEEFEALNYDPCLPLRLPPASAFTLEMLEDWFELAIGFGGLTIPAGLTAQVLYEKSERGIPQYVVETICKHCGSSWEGGLAKWLI
ncbi:MAG: XRE family transcriptional regulator [Cyanobacteria bacterium P01_F01_bin.143]